MTCDFPAPGTSWAQGTTETQEAAAVCLFPSLLLWTGERSKSAFNKDQNVNEVSRSLDIWRNEGHSPHSRRRHRFPSPPWGSSWILPVRASRHFPSWNLILPIPRLVTACKPVRGQERRCRLSTHQSVQPPVQAAGGGVTGLCAAFLCAEWRRRGRWNINN